FGVDGSGTWIRDVCCGRRHSRERYEQLFRYHQFRRHILTSDLYGDGEPEFRWMEPGGKPVSLFHRLGSGMDESQGQPGDCDPEQWRWRCISVLGWYRRS